MKMTQENMKRFDDMLRKFAKENNLYVNVNHEFDKDSTHVEFKLLEQNGVLPMIVYWDTKKSLTEACTVIFMHVTRSWNLDNGTVEASVPEIKDVIFNDPATIVLWEDGTKTVAKCQDGDIYSKETGLALCIAKKALGNKGNFNEVFKKWIPEEAVYPVKPEVNYEIGYSDSFNPRFMSRLQEDLEKCIMDGLKNFNKKRGMEG